MKRERSSGILCHLTSLPGKYGIGDMGPAAYEFLEFLQASGHRYWQLLPLNPTDWSFGHSPYSTHAAFAGNPLLISPELLEDDGYIRLKDHPSHKGWRAGRVMFGPVEAHRREVLDAAWKTFKNAGGPTLDYMEFERIHAAWLDDYCMYQALRKKLNYRSWVEWPPELRDRSPEALTRVGGEIGEEVQKEKFFQYLFFRQWERLKKEGNRRNIRFFGDIPFYMNHDSADCWTAPSIFKLDASRRPRYISGVPPDLFSRTGQLWGTPVYDWKQLKKQGYGWWISRLKQNLRLFDVVRLDHFRGFSAYWQVPASERTAEKGKWVRAPGEDFFHTLQKEIPDMPFIAEDLGSLDQDVYDLLEKFKFPRMKVLQFAFGDDYGDNPYLPFHHLPGDVVYTGTHDNNTSLGWFRKSDRKVKAHLREYVGKQVKAEQVHRVLHRLSLQSCAGLSITPLQDLLGLGEEAIMNIPSSTKGNWSWRVRREELPDSTHTSRLRFLNYLYGRIQEK